MGTNPSQSKASDGKHASASARAWCTCIAVQEKERLERALRQAGGDPAAVQAISRSSGCGKASGVAGQGLRCG